MDEDKKKQQNIEPEPTPVEPPQDQSPSVEEAIAPVIEKLESVEEKIKQLTPPEEEPEKPSWQPKSWDDIPALIEQRAKEITEQTLKEREEAEVFAKQAEEAKQKAIDAEFDAALV